MGLGFAEIFLKLEKLHEGGKDWKEP